MNEIDAEKIMFELQKPFPAEDIEWRVGATNADKSKGIALAYITNRAIMNRLDELFGPFGWRNEYREWKDNSQLCGISIKFGGEWITKWDGADDSQTEAVKGGLSDAMKRAGYQWGIGRYLYNLENIWCPIKQAGRSYALNGTPRLPEWALPEGYKQKQESQTVPETDPLTQNEIDEDLAAIAASSAEINKRPSKSEPSGNFVTEGQAKMLYAKYKQSEFKELPKTDVLELISAQLAKKVEDFKFVEKSDVNKVIKWFEEHAA